MMLGLITCALLSVAPPQLDAPPLQRPKGMATPVAPTQPATQPAPAPAPAPIQPELAPAEPAPIEFAQPLAPADPVVERYEDPAPALARPFKVPKSGTGNIVNGASMIGAGLTVAVPLGMLGSMAGGDASTAFIFSLPALVVAAGGGGLLALGIVRERRVTRWSQQEGITPPPSGKGLMAGGVWLALGGTAVTVIGTQFRGRPNANQRMAAGIGASVAGGLGMLAWGAVRQVRRKRWSEELSVTPYAMPNRDGFSLGVAGRF